MKRIEIKWKEIDEFLNNRLIAGGMDLSRKIQTFSKWEDGKVTLVYEQEEDASLTEEAELQVKLQQKPEYLR